MMEVRLQTDIEQGCLDQFALNRSIPAVRFLYNDGLVLQFEGLPAKKFIDYHDDSMPLMAIFKTNPVINLETGEVAALVGDTLSNYADPIAIRFELGAMLIHGDKLAVLDWDAVKEWEARGGLDCGIPETDTFRTRLRITYM